MLDASQKLFKWLYAVYRTNPLYIADVRLFDNLLALFQQYIRTMARYTSSREPSGCCPRKLNLLPISFSEACGLLN